MTILVEEDDMPGSAERCCFCRAATRHWALWPNPAKVTGDSVACCRACARRGYPADLPTKTEWFRRERIAHNDGKPVPPPLPSIRKRTP